MKLKVEKKWRYLSVTQAEWDILKEKFGATEDEREGRDLRYEGALGRPDGLPVVIEEDDDAV